MGERKPLGGDWAEEEPQEEGLQIPAPEVPWADFTPELIVLEESPYTFWNLIVQLLSGSLTHVLNLTPPPIIRNNLTELQAQ